MKTSKHIFIAILTCGLLMVLISIWMYLGAQVSGGYIGNKFGEGSYSTLTFQETLFIGIVLLIWSYFWYKSYINERKQRIINLKKEKVADERKEKITKKRELIKAAFRKLSIEK